jgi:hypothetical protein
MASNLFVVNEWLLEDLIGANGQERQAESFKFLETLRDKPDRIAVLEASPWVEKAYKLMKHPNRIIRQCSKFLHLSILPDSNKCLRISQNELKNLPEEVKSQSPTEDLYLVETYYSVDANALITTDQKLLKALANTIIHVELRDDFLKNYLVTSN